MGAAGDHSLPRRGAVRREPLLTGDDGLRGETRALDAGRTARSWRCRRAVEKRAYDLFLQNLVKGTSHLSLGQEAVAAGFAAAMRQDDYTFCTYRGHAHTLARGAPMAAFSAS